MLMNWIGVAWMSTVGWVGLCDGRDPTRITDRIQSILTILTHKNESPDLDFCNSF